MSYKGKEGSNHGLLKVLACLLPESTVKNSKNLSQDSKSGPHTYEAKC